LNGEFAPARGHAGDRTPISTTRTSDVFGLQVKVGVDGNVATEPTPSFEQPPPSRADLAFAPDTESRRPAGQANRLDKRFETRRDSVDKASWREREEVEDETTIFTPQSPEGLFENELQVMPRGLMYTSYVAGEKESRFQAVWLNEKNRGLVWETALGGRIGLLRYGNSDAFHPEGWQLDLEGAALARVNPEQHDDLEAVDFRAGFISTWCFGPNRYKAGYYHLSSHVGDEFLIANPGFNRLNYVRDSLVVGYMRDVTPELQVYGEVGYALSHEDGALPLELQYGIQYTPLEFRLRGAPFCAINGHTREDFNYSTSVNIVAGWQWRGERSNQAYRVGVQYYEGPSMQWSFVNKHESLLGGGMWCDF
jgi:hypothetical protein